MSQIKGGRKPISDRGQAAESFMSKSKLSIPADVAKEIDEQGLEARWISAKDFTTGGNYHEREWQPYKRKTSVEKSGGTIDLSFGKDPEGYIRRQSLVLAVRPKSLGDAHREFLEQRRRQLHGEGVQGRAAREMRESVNRAGASKYVKVDTDYDD